MCEQSETVCFSMPDWARDFAAFADSGLSMEGRMEIVIEAARKNVFEKTGGPFAAGVFEAESGKLIALGVNLVTTESLSMLHGEMVALSLAQRNCQTWNLGSQDVPAHELVTSTEPCAMCLGGICWSGVTRVISGATEMDARQLGFDEGPKPGDWVLELQQRGIEVVPEVLRDEAVAVLTEYRQKGGVVYNAR
jgi:tRNA(Arg) A34 adenosine deaminase TadA